MRGHFLTPPRSLLLISPGSLVRCRCDPPPAAVGATACHRIIRQYRVCSRRSRGPVQFNCKRSTLARDMLVLVRYDMGRVTGQPEPKERRCVVRQEATPRRIVHAIDGTGRLRRRRPSRQAAAETPGPRPRLRLPGCVPRACVQDTGQRTAATRRRPEADPAAAVNEPHAGGLRFLGGMVIPWTGQGEAVGRGR